MIKGPFNILLSTTKTHVCPDHGTPLVVAWHAEEDSYVLRCGEGHFPEQVMTLASLTELWRRGELPDGPIADNIERRERKKAMSQSKQSTAVTFTGVPAADLGTGELLVPEVVKALVAYATKYHLDAARSHVVLMYGKPYITIDGYLYHANQSKIPYTLESRPLTDEERLMFRAEEGSHVWISKVKLGDPEITFVGYGVVTKDEMEAKSSRDSSKLRSPVVAAHPWQLAQKRGDWQALRRAFPIGKSEEVSKGDSSKDKVTPPVED